MLERALAVYLIAFISLALLLTACAERVDLYVVMDGSGSIGQQNFNRMKAFLSELVDDLTVSRSMT